MNALAPADLSDKALEWVMRLHSGTQAVSAADFERWRAQSPDHELAACEAEALWAQMSGLYFDPRARLVRPGAAPARQAVLSRRLTLALAGLAMGGGAAFWAGGGVMRLGADYTSAVAAPRRIRLEDGSVVHLNARSALDLRYHSTRRVLHLLEGQAFFEVARDPRPFEVQADGVRIIALGTAFDVARDLPGGRVEIAVSQHAVRVEAGAGRLELNEGQSVRASRNQIDTALPRDPAVTAAWREGLYIAENRELREIIAALSAWHYGRIILRGEAVGRLRVNAVLDLADPVGSLETLRAGLPLRIRHVTKFMTIISMA